jgi:hypothetical protein
MQDFMAREFPHLLEEADVERTSVRIASSNEPAQLVVVGLAPALQPTVQAELGEAAGGGEESDTGSSTDSDSVTDGDCRAR